MKAREWTWFLLLGAIWGSSYLWIKIAVQEVGPTTLVAFRLLFGLLGLLIVLAFARPRFPVTRGTWVALAVLGTTNTAIPFILISWGEQFVDSAVASILVGTVPLFTLVIAHFALHDDRMTLTRLVGLLVGFAGVAVVMGRDVEAGSARANLLGQLAILAASFSYGGSSVLARRFLRQVDPIVQAFVPLAVAEALSWGAVSLTELPLQVPARPITWLALAWLGLLGSCLAYLLYFQLIHAVGPTRATTVTYVSPVVGVILGIAFLSERLDWHLFAGTLLVVLGIGVENRRARTLPRAAATD